MQVTKGRILLFDIYVNKGKQIEIPLSQLEIMEKHEKQADDNMREKRMGRNLWYPNCPKALFHLLGVSQRFGSEFSCSHCNEGNIISHMSHCAHKAKE